MFLKKIVVIRINESQHNKLKKLRTLYPDLFESDSHVIRCAINFFSKKLKEGGLNELRRKEE